MQRKDLEHLIRAAAGITNEYEFVILGSQSILGAVPDAPPELAVSVEADIYPLNRPDLADLIDGTIGELSRFDETYGYYAQGVGPETATLPRGWESRLVKIQNENTDLKIGYCLDPHDLAASKLAAGREKDRLFVESMFKHGLLDQRLLCERVEKLPVSKERAMELMAWVKERARKTEVRGSRLGGERAAGDDADDEQTESHRKGR